MRARSLRKFSSGKDMYEARNGSCWSRLEFILRDHVHGRSVHQSELRCSSYGLDGRWVDSQGNGQVSGRRSGIAEEKRAVTRERLLECRLARYFDKDMQILLLH
ncbi:hypothetical protein E4U53_004345 [Claviceps sorghi]|nr:hypothetical protein E4U53_004345 [Claviceps sorghi]